MTKHREPLPERPPSFLTRASLAAELDCSESTVDEWVRRGILPKPVKLPDGNDRWRWQSVRDARSRSNYIYVIACGDFIKIGITGNLNRRVYDLQRATPYPLALVHSFMGSPVDEAQLHARFSHCNHRGEWFRKEGKLAEWIDAGCKPQ